MLNMTDTYRRDGRGSLRVPVVMPLVEVAITDDELLDVTLDREPYSAEGVLHRADLPGVLADITADLGTPVRIQISEPDGSCFTDIVTPGSQPSQQTSSPPPSAPANEIVGAGFLPGEEVAVAVVVAHQLAGNDGKTKLRIPPALLESRPDAVVLFGRRSGTVMLNSGPT